MAWHLQSLGPKPFLALFGVLGLGCSWSRFDDVTSNSPVVLLNKPETLQAGFGVTLAALTSTDHSQLLSAGSANRSAAAVFDIGFDEEPGIDAIAASHCGDKTTCYLGGQVAALARAKTTGGSKSLCFALGIGTANKQDGVLVRCEQGFTYTLLPPEKGKTRVVDEVLDKRGGVVVTLAAGPEREPALIVGAGAKKVAWYYPSASADPFELEVPDTEERSYGQTVASLAVDDSMLLLVGAPSTGHVWLFRDGAEGPTPLGCLSGSDDFGRTLAAGYVTTDKDTDVAIADGSKVYVFDGAALAEIEPPADPATTPDCVSISKHDALLGTLACAETDEVEGCSGSGFGDAVAIGDLDGDGDGEVIVGAPKMSARGTSAAGAVLVYDLEGKSGSKLADAKFLSSAESDDNLGGALAAPSVGKRQIVAAGAPGGGKTALFYCSALGGTSSRCE